MNLGQLNTRMYLRLLILSVFMMLTVYAFPQVFDFTIAEDDVEILNGMHDGRHVSWDPSFIVWTKVWAFPCFLRDQWVTPCNFNSEKVTVRI